MSVGPRIPHAQMMSVAAELFKRWSLDPKTSFVVGSVRRSVSDVGDLELLCPLPPDWQNKQLDQIEDPIFEAINRTMDEPWISQRASLFNSRMRPVSADKIGRAVKGLKPGFLAANLLLRPFNDDISVDVFRYTRENMGWMLIEKTGPAEYGKWFLWKWKERHGIPPGDDRFKASIDNHLVDVEQKRVFVATEEEAFHKCGLRYCPPDRRDAFIEFMSTPNKAS